MKAPKTFDIEKAIFGMLLLFVVDRVVYIASETFLFPSFSVPQKPHEKKAKMCELIVILLGMGLIIWKN